MGDVPKRLQGKRMRMIVDLPMESMMEITGLIQCYAQKFNFHRREVPFREMGDERR